MRKSMLKLWGTPLFLFAILLYGLISALVGEGIRDIIACALLSIPIVVIGYKYYVTPKTRLKTSENTAPKLQEALR